MPDIGLPILIIGLTLALSWPTGRYLRWAMDPVEPRRSRNQLEALVSRIVGEGALGEQDWKAYLRSMLLTNLGMFLFAYAILVAQGILPLNPDGKVGLASSLAFHTAASFTTNTNLQHYAGEQALSYLSQLFGIMWLQFLSAATGIAAAAALCRGLAGRNRLGNYFVDMSRALILVLLPLSLVVGVLLLVAGVPMTLNGAAVAKTLEGTVQIIARGPVAAVVAIKQIGTNGGGFFGPNAAHPFENPGFGSNILCNVSILLLPMATIWMFGRITGRMRHALVIFGVMFTLYVSLTAAAVSLEAAPTPAFRGLPVTGGMNLEGKELRFGGPAAAFWGVSTTSTSNGSVNSMLDSLNPLTGLTAMAGMWLNVIFGGVGVGLINMFIFIIVAVFIAGLMVGRTPEYLTRKVEAKEMTLATIALLAHPLFILGGVAIFATTSWGLGTIQNPGSHGLSEIIYEFSSAAANNGSGFEGLADNTVPWNVVTGLVMLLARFIPLIAPLAIIGSLSLKKGTPESAGTFRVDTWAFGAILFAVIVIVGALLFLPLAMLGPIAEHLSTLT